MLSSDLIRLSLKCLPRSMRCELFQGLETVKSVRKLKSIYRTFAVHYILAWVLYVYMSIHVYTICKVCNAFTLANRIIETNGLYLTGGSRFMEQKRCLQKMRRLFYNSHVFDMSMIPSDRSAVFP